MKKSQKQKSSSKKGKSDYDEKVVLFKASAKDSSANKVGRRSNSPSKLSSTGKLDHLQSDQ